MEKQANEQNRHLVKRMVQEWHVVNGATSNLMASMAAGVVPQEQWTREPLRDEDIEVFDIGPKTKKYITPEPSEDGDYAPIPVHGAGQWLILHEAPGKYEVFWTDEDGDRWDFHDGQIEVDDDTYDETTAPTCMVSVTTIGYGEDYMFREKDGAVVSLAQTIRFEPQA